MFKRLQRITYVRERAPRTHVIGIAARELTASTALQLEMVFGRAMRASHCFPAHAAELTFLFDLGARAAGQLGRESLPTVLTDAYAMRIAKSSRSIAQPITLRAFRRENQPEHPSRKREGSHFVNGGSPFPPPFSWHCFELNSCARRTAGALLRALSSRYSGHATPLWGFGTPATISKPSQKQLDEIVPVPPKKLALGLGAAATRFRVPKRTGQEKEITCYDIQSTHSHRLPRSGC